MLLRDLLHYILVRHILKRARPSRYAQIMHAILGQHHQQSTTICRIFRFQPTNPPFEDLASQIARPQLDSKVFAEVEYIAPKVEVVRIIALRPIVVESRLTSEQPFCRFLYQNSQNISAERIIPLPSQRYYRTRGI